MVNVWATYCDPCLSKMPAFAELTGEYPKEEFQIIGIVSDVKEEGSQDKMELAEDLIRQTGADYPHLPVNDSLYDAFLGDVSAVPTTFFVDRQGRIADTVIGAMDKEAWEEKINEFLGED